MRVFSILFFLLLLVGCRSDSEEMNLIQHPNRLHRIILRCEALEEDQMRHNENCITAIKVNRLFEELSNEMQDERAFGEKILNLQMKLATLDRTIGELKEKENTTKEAKLKSLQKEREKLNHRIQAMIILVAKAEGMR